MFESFNTRANLDIEHMLQRAELEGGVGPLLGAEEEEGSISIEIAEDGDDEQDVDEHPEVAGASKASYDDGLPNFPMAPRSFGHNGAQHPQVEAVAEGDLVVPAEIAASHAEEDPVWSQYFSPAHAAHHMMGFDPHAANELDPAGDNGAKQAGDAVQDDLFLY